MGARHMRYNPSPIMKPSRKDSHGVSEVRLPIGVFADVHGNLPALEAVLRALADSRVATILAVGDLFFPGDDPVGVWKRLQEVQARMLRGATDRALALVDPAKIKARNEGERARLERLKATREALGELCLARLKRTPEALRLTLPGRTEVTVVHGSPTDPDTPISLADTDDEVELLLGDDPGDLVLCAGAHVPFAREVGDVRVVGLGSVGESPEGRVAHYTVILPGDESPVLDTRWVEY